MPTPQSAHGRGAGDGVADGGRQAAGIVDVDSGQCPGGGGHHIFGQWDRHGPAGAVDLDYQFAAMHVKGEASAVTETTEATGKRPGDEVFDDKLRAVQPGGGSQCHPLTITAVTAIGGESAAITTPAVHLESGFTVLPTDILGGHPLPQHGNRTAQRSVVAGFALMAMLAGGCKSNPIDAPPPTIEAAQAAQSPATTTTPAGQVLPLPGNSHSAVVDAGSLVVLTPGADAGPGDLSVFDRSGTRRTVPLPGPATAIAAGRPGSVLAATRGGFFTVDLATSTATRTVIEGAADADFTALARRSDGRMVLGSADGVAYTLAEDMSVAAKADRFARVDAIAAQGDTAVVLDRGQTSVTALTPDGSPALALRAGLGATTITADPVGRVLVADTRGGQLLVYGVDPLIQRQAYPVGESPYGLAGSATLVWVSLTASNTVVGYDLATGIPVEKVRYPTVQQPNTLAYDEASDTLYVVSGAGAGVQVIRNAARPR